jgi:hypothetical protein
MSTQTKYVLKRVFSFLLLILTTFTIAIFSLGCQPKWEIHNPYGAVDWDNHQQYRANFHTHTTISDGSLSPQAVVDFYHQEGYKILSITDHDRVTYPWGSFEDMQPSNLSRIRNAYGLSGIKPENSSHESRGITPDDLIFENRDHSRFGMVAIQGNEITLNKHHLSRGKHDMGSYFSDQSDTTITEKETLKAISSKNGLAMFMHPGRYNFSVDWYLDLYQQFDPLIGVELYNGGETRCIELWDSLLVKLMPQRPVWGFSNTDMHTLRHYGRNWNVFILPELNENWVRRGMEQGLFFFVYAPEGRHDRPVDTPEIQSINVNQGKGSIHIQAVGQDSTVWISGGNKIHTGDQIRLNELPEVHGYVRAVLYGEGGKTILGTQPFGIVRRKN